MENIYNIKGEDSFGIGNIDENNSNDYEKEFIKQVSNLICEILNINWDDRRIVKSLLFNLLNDKLNNRAGTQGLLQQYFASQIDQTVKSLKRKLSIPDKIKVNHDYATHAKLNDIAEYLKENYVQINKNNDKKE